MRGSKLDTEYRVLCPCRGGLISGPFCNGHESKIFRSTPVTLPDFISEAQSLQVLRRFPEVAPDRPRIGYVTAQLIRQ